MIAESDATKTGRAARTRRRLWTVGVVAIFLAASAAVVAQTTATESPSNAAADRSEAAGRVGADASPPTELESFPQAGDVVEIESDTNLLEDPPIVAVSEPTPSSANEPSGSFRFGCAFSHLAYDDPIVYPDQPGSSHLHMFFGNDAADASSDYRSLRTSGGGTCQGAELNRSAYWMPAMLDDQDMVVVPSWIVVYYKGPGVEPDGSLRDVVAPPPGLRMIAGRQVNDPDSFTTHRWRCEGDDASDLVTIPVCPADEDIIVSIPFPHCWDGVNLDAPDHRSHTAYVDYDQHTGQPGCPATHPVWIPEFTLNVGFANSGDSDGWRLASDGPDDHHSDARAAATHDPGSSFHSDWFGAWDPSILQTWTDECINGLLNCNSGDLGDGTRLETISDVTRTPDRLERPER